MQIQLQKLYQMVLTGIGLCLLILALVLNHSHPHNEGIANLTRGYVFQELGISSVAASNNSGLSYMKPVKIVTPPTTDKMPDPTTPAPDQPAALPPLNQASDDTDKSTSQNVQDTTNVKDNQGQQNSATAK